MDKQKIERLHSFYLTAQPLCEDYTYPLGVMLTLWAVWSYWGSKVPGRNNPLFTHWSADRQAYGQCKDQAFSWFLTREYFTYSKLTKLSNIESSRIHSTIFKPDIGKYEVQLERRFVNFFTLSDCIVDKVTILKDGLHYKKGYKQWLNDKDDRVLLKTIANRSTLRSSYYGKLLRTYEKPSIQRYLYYHSTETEELKEEEQNGYCGQRTA